MVVTAMGRLASWRARASASERCACTVKVRSCRRRPRRVPLHRSVLSTRHPKASDNAMITERMGVERSGVNGVL